MIRSRHKGFTLIEMAIVMAISGVLLASFVQAYRIYLKGNKPAATYVALDKFNNAMNAFFNTQKRYPCPTDPALPDTDPNFGFEKCIQEPPTSTPIGACNGGICRVAGRNADGTGGPDGILIGAIPYKTLKIAKNDIDPNELPIKDDIAICNGAFSSGSAAPANLVSINSDCGVKFIRPMDSLQDMNSGDTVDAWGNRMTYAVSDNLTSASKFDVALGAVTVTTENGQSLSDPPGSVMWVLVSHGEDGVGAYTINGTVASACGGVPAVDTENCNNNGTFIDGILFSAPGATHFDDILYFSVMRLSSLWNKADPSGATGSREDIDITNRNIGKVGFGLAAGTPPAERLDVAGYIRAQNGISAKICDSTGNECFDPGNFGSVTGDVCASPPGTISLMTGIANGVVQCSAPIIGVATVPAQDCPAGKDLQAITTTGALVCAP